MPRYVRVVPADAAEIAASLAELRASLDIPVEFPPAACQEAEAAARAASLPERDETAIPFVTVDPPGSLDLDQALHLERRNGGYVVRYAIADVAAFVTPGGPMDEEAHARGQTLYAPDGDARLYPPRISEDAASLLPDQVRPALVWTMTVDEGGEGTAVEVRRARIRSRAKLDYATVQRAIDDGTAEEPLRLLREVGRLRQEREARRGGLDLQLPEQEVERGPHGYELSFRAPHPVEGWNAQISLLAGQAAAELMLAGGVGILRTLPAADEGAVRRLRLVARALDVEWPDDTSPAEFVRGLDPTVPAHAAVLAESTVLLRGSGYAAFDGDAPAASIHAGIGAPYAHTTAPIRRLVDRYVGEVCIAVSAGNDVPAWVRAALPALPETMERSNGRAQQYEAGIVSTVEAAVLAGRIGEEFDAVVLEVDADGDGGAVQLREPAVAGRCGGALPLGERVRVRLEHADVAKREVRFALAG